MRERKVSKGSNEATALSRDQSGIYSILQLLKNFVLKYMSLWHVNTFPKVLDFKITYYFEISKISSSLKIKVIFHSLQRLPKKD